MGISEYLYCNMAVMQEFYNQEFNNVILELGEYEKCTFVNCVMPECDLGEFKFTDCLFNTCNLSMVQVKDTAFKTVSFKNCKLLGINFSSCDPFLLAIQFENCILNMASFYKLKLKGIVFRNCELQESDFVQTDLTNAKFDHCDLGRAKFENTLLEKTDFRTAHNFSIDPQLNKLKKTQFSRNEIMGLLDRLDIIIE